MGSRLLHRYAKEDWMEPTDVHPWLVSAMMETPDCRPPAIPATSLLVRIPSQIEAQCGDLLNFVISESHSCIQNMETADEVSSIVVERAFHKKRNDPLGILLEMQTKGLIEFGARKRAVQVVTQTPLPAPAGRLNR